jgi:predicted nuclease of restriction endonuclease-like (RecB) superfamily
MKDRTINNDLTELLTAHFSNGRALLPRTAWALGNIARAFSSLEKKQLVNYIRSGYHAGFNIVQLNACIKMAEHFPVLATISDRLSLSHYKLLNRIEDVTARNYYHKEAIRSAWTTCQLKRQLKSRFYERINQGDNPLIKEEYVFEFTRQYKPRNEQELELALIEKLEDLLLELGDGFAFVARQKRLLTESGKSFFVDLVFYNYTLRCFVLFELKTGSLNHRDIGQLDGYVRYFDQHLKLAEDNKTIGVLLCTQKDQTIIRYSMLDECNNLHAATYQVHWPEGDAS